jgi:hypothetical protein
MIRTFLKFAALAAGIALLLATTYWARLEVEPRKWDYWGNIDEPLQWVIFINQLATGIAVVVLLARERIQRGRMLGIILAAGLLGTTLLGIGAELLGREASLLGMATLILDPGQEIYADLLGLCFAVGLVVAFAGTKRWKPLCVGMAALAGALMRIMRLVWLARSFM